MDKQVQFVTEDMNVHESWYAEAQQMRSIDDIVPFITKLMTEYSHDMNTVIHALNAGALATISIMNNFPEGKISSTQAHKLLGLFVRKWAKMQGPLTIIQWYGLLHADNEEAFYTVQKSVWDDIRSKAVELLAQDEENRKADLSGMTYQEKNVHEESLLKDHQREHLLSIRDGKAPWGIRVVGEQRK